MSVAINPVNWRIYTPPVPLGELNIVIRTAGVPEKGNSYHDQTGIVYPQWRIAGPA